jgi:NitT/TauT family transport system substrate-binding protein
MLNRSMPRSVIYILLILIFGMICADFAMADAQIAYRLKWLRNMSTVGDIYALTNGSFKAQGLDVTIKPGGPEIDAIRELELGQAQFGVASADQVIRAVSKGAPVVVVAQLFQVNPLQWIYRTDRLVVRQPTDLKGKTLGVTFGKNDEIIMRTLMAQAQIQEDQVRLFSVRLDYTPFYKGTVDLWPVYINTQGVEIGAKMAAAGEKIAFFDPNAHGVRFVANSVVTSKRVLARSPEIVRRFVRALLEGWRQALDPNNADQAVAAVKKFDKDTKSEIMVMQLAQTRQLILPHSDTILGAIDKQAWRQTEAIMRAHKLIDRPVNIIERLIVLDE